MGSRRLEKLGRSLTVKDHQFRFWALNELAIDEYSGLGFKGLVYSGKKCPRPYYTNQELDRRWQYTSYPYIPKNLFAHCLDQRTPCFFYSDIRKGFFVINIDCDNNFDIPSGHRESQFWLHVFNLLKSIGLKGAFTQHSTNKLGTHSYISVSITNDDWFDPDGGIRTYTSLSNYVRRVVLNFQSALRNYCTTKQIPMHVDVLGLPAVYDDQGRIIKRGSWIKMPFDMKALSQRKKFEKRQTVKLSDLINITNKINENCKKTTNKKTLLELKPFKSSTDTNGRWDMRSFYEQFFVRHFGDDTIPFYKKSLINKHEFAEYLIAIELASRVTQTKQSKDIIFKNTLPTNLIRAIFNKNIVNGYSLSNRNYDDRKSRFILSFLRNHRLVTVIDFRHFYIPIKTDVEVFKGTARKWFLNKLFYTFFENYNIQKAVLFIKYSPFPRVYKQSLISVINTGKRIFWFYQLSPIIWILYKPKFYNPVKKFLKNLKFHLRL
jgi:hypothetical protein